MVDNFYQTKMQPTIDKTKKLMNDSQVLLLTFIFSVSATIIMMILFNFPNSIMNSTEFDVIVLGNIFLGFALFSAIFTIMVSVAVALIFSIIIAPSTKNQLLGFKDACIDYAQIFRELRKNRNEVKEERLIQLFDDALEKMMQKYDIKSFKATGEILTKAHTIIETQDKKITSLESRIEILEKEKNEKTKIIGDKAQSNNNTENSSVKKDNQFDEDL